jgi:hypothetical protein
VHSHLVAPGPDDEWFANLDAHGVSLIRQARSQACSSDRADSAGSVASSFEVDAAAALIAAV